MKTPFLTDQKKSEGGGQSPPLPPPDPFLPLVSDGPKEGMQKSQA